MTNLSQRDLVRRLRGPAYLFLAVTFVFQLADYLVYRPKPRRRAFRILRTDRGYRVVGRPPDEAQLEAALRAAGAKTGDEVVVGDKELELG